VVFFVYKIDTRIGGDLYVIFCMKHLAVKLLFFIGYLLIFLLIGCDFPTDSEADFQEDLFLFMYMNNTKDGSLYLVDYPIKDCGRINFYASVKYLTTPATSVFWTLPVCGHTGTCPLLCPTNPSINYFSNSKDDGSGEQKIYLNENMVNDTLTVIGCINEDYCKSLKFIVMER